MSFTLNVKGETHTIVHPCPRDFNNSINSFINGSSKRKRVVMEFFKSSVKLDTICNNVTNIVKNTQKTTDDDNRKNQKKQKRMAGILARHAQRAMLYGVYIEQKKQENRQHRFQKQLAKAKRFCYMLPFCVL